MSNPKDAHGMSKPALRLVPPALALHVSQAMADGARKYGAYNWRRQPVRLTVYLEAAMRHILSALDGEDRARDSGHLHVAHVAASMAIILDALETGNLIDDRAEGGCAADVIERMTIDEPIPYVPTVEPEPAPAVDPPFYRSSSGSFLVDLNGWILDFRESPDEPVPDTERDGGFPCGAV